MNSVSVNGPLSSGCPVISYIRRFSPHALSRRATPLEDADAGRARRDTQPLLRELQRGQRRAQAVLCRRHLGRLTLHVGLDRVFDHRAKRALDNVVRPHVNIDGSGDGTEIRADLVLQKALHQIHVAKQIRDPPVVRPEPAGLRDTYAIG
ncbi:hypothetical protein [Paraburkholderia sp. JPY419]|uniref:hypothetical protein n=1 Tax=Paraburkholderia sp. JPY419 TaxID=667660 RepID=UPI003D191581